MIKAIFFDIDGTLISFNTHTIPQSTIDAIQALKKSGVKVFIATGRTLSQLNSLAGLTFDGFITLNGAYCVNEQHGIIQKNFIPVEDIEALIGYLNEKERFPVVFVSAGGMAINYISETVKSMHDMVNLPPPPVRNLGEAARDGVLQINMYIDKVKEREIMRKVLVNCQATRWNSAFVDINLRGCSKQSGIDCLLEYHGIHLDETMCFGDGGNDIPMLQHVAIGVAMGNAANEVKRTANYVTDSIDDNGIWNALKHFKII